MPVSSSSWTTSLNLCSDDAKLFSSNVHHLRGRQHSLHGCKGKIWNSSSKQRKIFYHGCKKNLFIKYTWSRSWLCKRLVILVLWSMKHQEILQNNTPCLKMLLPRWVFYSNVWTYVTLYQGLSMIDTTQSAIKPYCPPFLMAPACSVKRYRSVEGICNNMENPHWGAAMNGHHR